MSPLPPVATIVSDSVHGSRGGSETANLPAAPARTARTSRAAPVKTTRTRSRGWPRSPTENEVGGNQTAALWTDARNGRGSGSPTTVQPGRNPVCEQSDVFFDAYSATNGGGAAQGGLKNDSLFWVTECPSAIHDKGKK